MSHLVIIEDAVGDAIDARIYCSDCCAREDEFYAGWNGCNDVDYNTNCYECRREIFGGLIFFNVNSFFG